MQYVVMGLCHCIGQACCWYNIYKCCGCIESRPHIQIERQQELHPQQPQPQQQQSSHSPNPFLGSGVPKGPYYESAYSIK